MSGLDADPHRLAAQLVTMSTAPAVTAADDSDEVLNPVAVLAGLLRQDPPPLTLTPATRSAHLTEAANQHWDRHANAAEVVTCEWASSDPASHPSGEQASTRIAGIAALAQASTALDRYLVHAGAAP